ncbi:MAG: TonB-dependent receptor [Alphaproteobacteria bacterium]|nr:TonB-dependent receptor [Alphaproteobacteria bacterium]
MALPATAQTASASAPAAAPADTGLAEIVVTATKRAQNLQDVPVAVTALSADTIKDQRINEFGDLTRAAASLTVTQAPASPNNAIVLRGIGTYAFSIGVEPSVAVIVDDVPVVQQAQAFDNLNDVDRIEVLRGPQGTLFGKNASAGAINIVTKDPGKSLSVSGELLATTDSQFGGNAAISAPLSDTAGIRVSGYYSHFNGYINNLYNGHLLGDETKFGIHAKLKVQITPRLTAQFIGSYSELNQNGTAGANGTLRYINLNYVPAGSAPGTAPVVPKFAGVSILPSLVGITPGDGNYSVNIDNDSPTSNAQATFSGKLTYDLGFANLISVTSYQDWKYNFSADVDMTGLNVVGTSTPVTSPTGPATGANQSGPYHSTELTQELRLTSKGHGPLSYVAGLYYSNAPSSRTFVRGPTFAPADWSGYQGTRDLAAFLGVDYRFATKTTLSVSGRLTNERIQDNFVNLLPNATVYQAGPPVVNGTCGAGSALCTGSNTDTVGTWKIALNQELAEHVMAYASVSTGYKGYAYDITSGYNPLRTLNPVLPEHSTAYEIGMKSRFFDNKAQLNIAAFLTDYNNFQAQSSAFVNGALQSKLNNVGKLRTKGVEVELMTRPARWLHLDGSAAYTDATIVSFPNAACYQGQTADQALAGIANIYGVGTCGASVSPTGLGNVQDRSGGQLPNSPKFKFTLSATADQDIGAGTKAHFNLNYQHQSSVNFDLLGDPLTVQTAYGVLNGSVGVEHGPFKLTAFANNLFDQHYATSLGDTFSTYGTHAVWQFQPRDSMRYFGLKIDYNY